MLPESPNYVISEDNPKKISVSDVSEQHDTVFQIKLPVQKTKDDLLIFIPQSFAV